ncbi:MAG: hypothetical protein IT385_23590 [Deltaproteobacteria bacterium]|nr:hypothetical protein [Deltaproteobacteria bacterium]
MKYVKEMFEAVTGRMRALVTKNAVVGRPISVGDRHVVTLCELSVGIGGIGGRGEGQEDGQAQGAGQGGAAGGRAAACPVAVLVIEGGKVRLEHLGT